MTAPRILVTGSRGWTDIDLVHRVLDAAWAELGERDDIVLVSGACPTGADAYAEAYWRHLGLPVERHPADWRAHGKAAGPIRNQAMVDAGADLCVAFIADQSRGATGCAAAAEHAGITVWRLETPAPGEMRQLQRIA